LLRQAKDARPGLGFGQGLAGAIIGEGLPGTVSSGSTLRHTISLLHPHPVIRAGGPCARESTALVSDDAFFSSGARTSGEKSTFHYLSSVTDVTTVTTLAIAILTEEMSVSSGSGTVVLPTYLVFVPNKKFDLKKMFLNLLCVSKKVTKKEFHIPQSHYMFLESFCNHKSYNS
jgi:hypothetical protein